MHCFWNEGGFKESTDKLLVVSADDTFVSFESGETDMIWTFVCRWIANEIGFLPLWGVGYWLNSLAARGLSI